MPSRKLEIEIIGDSSQLSRAFRGAVRDADTFGSRMRRVGAIGVGAFTALGAAGVAAGYGIYKSTQAAEEANKVQAQTKAALKSTGAEAWITADAVAGLAGAISRKAGIDDEEIQSAGNLLLTFKELRNETGKGNDLYDQALRVTTDLSVAMGKDLTSSAVMVGKALNDPVKGAGALSRAGVQLTEQQKEQIETFTESGETMRAQKIILRELESQFGGSAAAQATAIDKISVSAGNIQESFGNVFLPYIEDAATALDQELMPELQATTDALAEIASRKDIDLSEKLELSRGVVEKQWGWVPGALGDLVEDAIPVVAERAGDMGVAWAKGMLHGFIESDPLGRAAILLLASKAFGGPGALIGAGRVAGSKLGGGVVEGAAAGTAGGLAGVFGKAGPMALRAARLGTGLAIGSAILDGVQLATEDPADGIMARLEQIQDQGGLVGDFARKVSDLPVAGDIFNLTAGGNFDEQTDAAKRLEEVLLQINDVHGRRHQLLLEEGRELQDQLGLAKDERREVEATLRQQAVAGKKLSDNLRGLESGKFTTLPDIKAVTARNVDEISTRWAEGSLKARQATAENYRAAGDAIRTGINRGVIDTEKGMAEIRRLTRQAKIVSGDDPFGIAKGFASSWRRSGTVTEQSLQSIKAVLGKMPPEAAGITGRMMIQMAREMRRKGQLSKAEMEAVRSTVVTKVSLMAQQGGKKGEMLRESIGGSFGSLSQDVYDALEAIGVNVQSVMESLGAAGIPDWQLKVLKGKAPNAGKLGKRAAETLPELNRGGAMRVPGSGLQDTVPVWVNGALSAMVAPDETLVTYNRHQLPMVDEALAYRWGVRGHQDFFNTYDRPHHMARGGMHEPKLAGPDPLRSLGQAAIGKGFDAGVAYVRKHRPRPSPSAGVAGYVGPPPSFKQLGDNAWVDSHTMRVAQWLSSKFGVPITDGWRPQNASYGVANSSHKRGTPSNPGAFDFGTSYPLLNFAKKHIAGLTEAMIHDMGFGLHTHLAFFSGGGVVKTIGQILLNNGLDYKAAAGIIGNAYQESGWDPGATGMGGGGLWGFTASPNSLADLQAYAEKKGKSWEDPAVQTHFMLSHLSGDLKDKLNALDSVPATTELFMNEWERPYAPTANLGRRIEGGRNALDMMLKGGLKGGEEKSAPASKRQKRTLGSLRLVAAQILKEARQLKEQYEKEGGTPQGRKALQRTIKLAKEAARKVKAGSRDQAEDLIDKARDRIDSSRDSLEGAAAGVFTPGLGPTAMPGLATDAFDPGKAFSPENLPGVGGLPKDIRDMLRAPGLSRAAQRELLEGAFTEAGLTDTKVDDAAALNAMLGIDRQRRKSLKKQLREVEAEQGKGGKTKGERERLAKKADAIRSALGTVSGDVSADRERIKELNEGSTPADRADLRLARAESTADKGDDIEALRELEELARQELQQAEKSGDPREIAEATRNLKAAADALREATPTAEDWANRDLALAELTEDTADDRAALVKLQGIAQAKLDAALATADPRDDIDAAHELKSINDALASIDANTAASAGELATIAEELKKSRALAEAEMAVGLVEARRALADIISGELGPRIAEQSQTAGVGNVGTLGGF